MKPICITKTHKKYSYWIGIAKDFQGIGFGINFDNPGWGYDRFTKIEINFLWFHFDVIIKQKNKSDEA